MLRDLAAKVSVFLLPNDMAKRPADPSTSTQGLEGQAFSKAPPSANRRESLPTNEMGEFEDAWEDEVESDEEVIDAQANEDEDGENLWDR
jgi:ribosome assembly protein RRB1